MKKIVSSIIYLFSVIPVFFLTMLSINIIESKGWYHTIWRTGDIDVFILIIFLGVIVFGLTSYFLLHFETVKHPTLLNHIQHSSLLYIFFIILFTEYILNSMYTENGLQTALYAVILGVLFIGIIINAIILYLKSRSY